MSNNMSTENAQIEGDNVTGPVEISELLYCEPKVEDITEEKRKPGRPRKVQAQHVTHKKQSKAKRTENPIPVSITTPSAKHMRIADKTAHIADKRRAETLRGPIFVDGLIYLSPYDFARLEAFRYKKIAISVELEKKNLERAKLLLEFQSLTNKLIYEESDLQAKQRAYDNAYQCFNAEIAQLYAVGSEETFSYDDNNGRFMTHKKAST